MSGYVFMIEQDWAQGTLYAAPAVLEGRPGGAISYMRRECELGLYYPLWGVGYDEALSIYGGFEVERAQEYCDDLGLQSPFEQVWDGLCDGKASRHFGTSFLCASGYRVRRVVVDASLGHWSCERYEADGVPASVAFPDWPGPELCDEAGSVYADVAGRWEYGLSADAAAAGPVAHVTLADALDYEAEMKAWALQAVRKGVDPEADWAAHKERLGADVAWFAVTVGEADGGAAWV